MPFFVRRMIPLVIACVLPLSAWSVQLSVKLADEAPVIDGTVSPSEQNQADAVELTRIGGLDRPKFATKVYVSATLKGLYVGFIATEPSMESVITSTTEENGAVFDDDSLQVLITPTLDTAADSYYHFAVNTDGVRYSNHLISGEVVQNWSSAVSKVPQGWQAEFFIPLESISAPDELPYWRGNFARVRPARGNEPAETSAWINPGISLHNYKKFGYITMPRFVPAAPGATPPPYTTSTVEVFTTGTTNR